MVKQAVKGILGKTISGIVIKKNVKGGLPKEQLFLIFSDDTYYEFYTDTGSILTTGGIDAGGGECVRQYMEDAMVIIFEASFDEDEGGMKQ